MNYIHKQQAEGKWFELSLVEQLANVGSEVERAISWRKKSNQAYSERAFERALELLDLTIADEKNKSRLKEPLRVREALADYFYGDNQYGFTDEFWQKYFYYYNYLARLDVC